MVQFLLIFGIIPVFDVTRILEFVQRIGIEVVKWVALKAFIVLVCMTVLPIAAWKIKLFILDKIYQYVLGMEAGTTQIVLNFTGVAGWFVSQLFIPESLALIYAGITAGFIIRMVRI